MRYCHERAINQAIFRGNKSLVARLQLNDTETYSNCSVAYEMETKQRGAAEVNILKCYCIIANYR